jgi:hypothetical protein
MKFDKIAKKILLEVVGQTAYPDRKATYSLNPENALAKLASSYDFLKNYRQSKYKWNNHEENQKISNAAMQIALTVRDSNLNQYVVKDGDRNVTMSKTDLLKSILTLCQNFGRHDFAQQQRLIIPGIETSGKRDETYTAGPYHVPNPTADRPLLNDMSGHPIPAGTGLVGSDYRLSMYNDTKEIKRHGGVVGLHYVYREIFPMLGIRYQEYRRSGRAARIEGQAQGEEAADIQSFPVYWWGENFLPYRTVLKVRNGKVIRVERYNERHTQEAGINWKTDRVGGSEKPRPLVTVGQYRGPYGGDMQYGKTVDEVRRAIQFSDFEPIKREIADISELFKEAKKSKTSEAATKLRDIIRKQEAYNALSGPEKLELYKKRKQEYSNAYDSFRIHTIRPEIEQRPEDAYPFFTTFYRDSSGKYKFRASSAEQKFKELYPIDQVPELYQDRKKLGEVNQ